MFELVGKVFVDNNLVSFYCCLFKVLKGWEDWCVYFVFDGVDLFLCVWINGKEVGFSKDSCILVEWDIMDVVKLGENLFVVEVI